MKKRALMLLLALMATQSIGCFWCCRPFLIRRWWWNRHECCAPLTHDCCSAAPAVELGPVPPAAHPTMPPATPLTRR